MTERNNNSQTECRNPLLKKYAVVEFDDGVAVVPTSWMSSEEGLGESVIFLCWWPIRCKGIRKMVKEETPIDKSTWEQFYNVRILYSSNSWDKILEKERKAQDTSCLDTDQEDDGMNRRRARIPTRYQRSSTSSEDDPNDYQSPRAKLPRVPVFAHTPGRPSSRPVESSPRSSLNIAATPSRGRTSANTTATTSNRGFEITVIKLLTELTLECKDIRKRVDKNTALLDGICNNAKELFTLHEDPIEVDLGVDIPVSTFEDLQGLETKLADKVFARKVVLKLGVLGGKDVQTSVKSMLSNILAPELACKYNWTGVKGKREFQDLQVNTVILRAVRQKAETREATQADVKSAVVTYLYNARDLKGGRKRRSNGQQVDQQDAGESDDEGAIGAEPVGAAPDGDQENQE